MKEGFSEKKVKNSVLGSLRPQQISRVPDQLSLSRPALPAPTGSGHSLVLVGDRGMGESVLGRFIANRSGPSPFEKEKEAGRRPVVSPHELAAYES